MKKAICLCFVIMLALISGCGGTKTYKCNNFKVSYHSDWPTYGLPMAEYSFILERLEEGKIDRAKEALRSCLDEAIKDAKCRLEVASKEEKKFIQKALDKAVETRNKYKKK